MASASGEGSDAPSEHPILTRPAARLDALTGLRWWAAFVVFAHHAAGLAPLPGPAAAIAHYGYLGVTFFFVLSGFVLTWSWSPRVRVSTFYWRRFARIYPAHVVALLLAIPVFTSFTPISDEPWKLPFDAVALLLALVLLQAWSSDPAVFFAGNPVAWSLTYEAFFYATHPLIARGLARVRVRGALVAALVVALAVFGVRAAATSPEGAWVGVIPSPVLHLGEFVLGACLAWALRSGWRPRIPVTVGLAVVAAAIAVIVFLPRALPGSWAATFAERFPNEIATVACAVAIVAFAARALRGRSSLLAHPVMVRLGEWSFAFYLVHQTVIYLLLEVFGAQPSGWTAIAWFGGSLVLSIAASAGLHLLVEKPAERRLRRWKDARDADRAAPLPDR